MLRIRTVQLSALVATTALTVGLAAPVAEAARPPVSPYAYVVADFPNAAQGQSRMAIDAEYETLYVLDKDDAALYLVDSTTGAVRAVADVEGDLVAVDITAHVAYTHQYETDELTAVNRDGSTRAVPGMGLNTIALAADPRTSQIYGVDFRTSTVNVVAATGGRVATIPVGEQPESIAIDDPGRRAYVTSSRDNSVSVIDLDSHTVEATIDVPSAYSVGVDVVAHRAYVGSDDGSGDVSVIDGSAHRVVDTIPTTLGEIFDLAIDPVTHTAYAINGRSVAAIDLAAESVTDTFSALRYTYEAVVDPIRHVALVSEDDVKIQQITQLVKQRAIVRELSATTGSTAGGEQITITGDHFAGASKVLFGNTPATSFTVESDQRIVATVPPHKAGKVSVTVKTTDRRSASRYSRYTYVAPAG